MQMLRQNQNELTTVEGKRSTSPLSNLRSEGIVKVSWDTLTMNRLDTGCPKSAEPLRRTGGPSLRLSTRMEATSRRIMRSCTITTITSIRDATLRKFGNILSNSINNNNRITTLSVIHSRLQWHQEFHDHTVQTFWSTRRRESSVWKDYRRTALLPTNPSVPSLASGKRSALMTSGRRRCMRRRCEKVPVGNMTSGRCGRSLAGLVTPSADQAQHLHSQSLLASSSSIKSSRRTYRRQGTPTTTLTDHRATRSKCLPQLSIRTRAHAEILIGRLHISSRTTRPTRRTRRLQPSD